MSELPEPSDSPRPFRRPPADVLDPRFYDGLGEVPEELFGEHLHGSVELVERYAREWAVEVARRLGLPAALREASGEKGAGVPALLGHLGLEPSFRFALSWVLEELVEDGHLLAVGPRHRPDERRYRLAGDLRDARREPVREAALEHDPANRPFFDLLDLAGEAYPEVARGGTTGEAALFGIGQTGLWLAYFDNANPVYALNNRLAAVAVAERLPDCPHGAHVLEVGAGAGSATAAVMERLEETGRAGRLASYRVTEPAAFFRRRAARSLADRFPDAPLDFDRPGQLDIGRFWEDQGVEAASLDLVLGVNVFHLAPDLQQALGAVRASLRPGGWLVIGECLRPRPGQPVAAEMAFQLFEGMLGVETDPELRPQPGFMTPELWTTNLEAAGFEGVTVVPDVSELARYYPKLSTGAVCGRVPNTQS